MLKTIPIPLTQAQISFGSR